MSRFGRRRYGSLYLIVLTIVLVSAGTWGASEVSGRRDRLAVAKLTEKQKTVCVGRFLVDVPAQAEVHVSNVIVDRFQVDTLDESKGTFRERVAAREASFKAGEANSASVVPVDMVEARDLHVIGMIGRTLIYQRHRSDASRLRLGVRASA